jgi:2-succinyl-6-hydroxy-2,4-cyclohexadiene-1-carboxylate synthase
MSQYSRLCRGNPCFPPLVFLHGFLGCKEDWKETIAYFEKYFYCIAIDLPGHGATPYTESILDDLKKEFPKEAICIGYSLGGRIALQLQHLFRGIVVLSGHPGLRTPREKIKRWQQDQEWSSKLRTLPFPDFLKEWYAQPVFQSLKERPHFLETLLLQRQKQTPCDLAQVLLQLSLAHQPHVEQFSCPALFLCGVKDLKYHEIYCKLPKTVTVRKVKDSGHAIHLENPSQCAQFILTWLKDTYANL